MSVVFGGCSVQDQSKTIHFIHQPSHCAVSPDARAIDLHPVVAAVTPMPISESRHWGGSGTHPSRHDDGRLGWDTTMLRTGLEPAPTVAATSTPGGE